jgi:hypothetical protein
MQEFPGRQHRPAATRGVQGNGLQQQRQELTDCAIATEQRFGCLAILRRPSECADGRHRLRNPLQRPTRENLTADRVIGRGLIKHDQPNVAQKQSGGIQIADRA